MKENNTESKEENVLAEWTVHLFKKEKKYRSILAIAAVATALAGGAYVVGEPIYVAVYALILFFTLGEFFFPVKYRVTDRGVYSLSCVGPRFMPWEKVRRLYKNDIGVKLSIFEYPSPMESFRGMLVRPGEEPEEKIFIIRELYKKARASENPAPAETVAETADV